MVKKEHGIALLDVSTGELLGAQGDQEYLNKLISNFSPSEILFQKNKGKEFESHFGSIALYFQVRRLGFYDRLCRGNIEQAFWHKIAERVLVLTDLDEAVIAAGAVFHYLGESEHKKLDHITGISRIEEDKYVWLDRFTIKNLELVSSPHENARTLSDILDETQTAMGSRMLEAMDYASA